MAAAGQAGTLLLLLLAIECGLLLLLLFIVYEGYVARVGHGGNAVLVQRLMGIAVAGEIGKRFLGIPHLRLHWRRIVLILLDVYRRRRCAAQRTHWTEMRRCYRRLIVARSWFIGQIQTAGRAGNGSSVSVPWIDVQLMAQRAQLLLQTGGAQPTHRRRNGAHAGKGFATTTIEAIIRDGVVVIARLLLVRGMTTLL